MDSEGYLKLELGLLFSVRQLIKSLDEVMPDNVPEEAFRRKEFRHIDRIASNIMKQNPHLAELLVSEDWKNPITVSASDADEVEDCPHGCGHKRLK